MIFAAVFTAVLLAASFVIGGASALVGMLLGLTTGAFGAYTLYAIVLLLKDAAGRSKTGAALTIIGFFAKFPVLGLGAYISYRLGMLPLGCFVAGVLVVYCGLVWRASRHGLYSH